MGAGGEHLTNNVAEYAGCVALLRFRRWLDGNPTARWRDKGQARNLIYHSILNATQTRNKALAARSLLVAAPGEKTGRKAFRCFFKAESVGTMQEKLVSNDLKSQSEIMRKNVSATFAMQRREAEGRSVQDRLAALMTDFSGSMVFVYLHAIWFGLWMLLNLGFVHIPHVTQFDPYPFGLLTLVVSLEAIFLSTFVLIAQNNLSAVSERRAELDLQVNLLAEQKTAKVLELLDTIARELDSMHSRFNYKSDAEIEALKLSPEPQDVLEVIEQGTNEEPAGESKRAGTISTVMDLVRSKYRTSGDKPDEVSGDAPQAEDPAKTRPLE